MIAAALLTMAQGGWDGHMSWDGGWWIVMALSMIVIWGLIVLGIVLVVRELVGSRADHRDRPNGAMAVLDRRLAEGDISPEEYRERRAILRGD